MDETNDLPDGKGLSERDERNKRDSLALSGNRPNGFLFSEGETNTIAPSLPYPIHSSPHILPIAK